MKEFGILGGNREWHHFRKKALSVGIGVGVYGNSLEMSNAHMFMAFN